MQGELGDDYVVITEALNGRTTCWDLPHLPGRNGSKMLPMLLASHEPLDLVVIMLGINDLTVTTGKNAKEAALGLMGLLRLVIMSACSPAGNAPEMLVICPPVIRKLSEMMEIPFGDGVEESAKLPEYFGIICKRLNSHFVDSNEFLLASDADGLHIDTASHRLLGNRIAAEARRIIGQ